MAMNALQLSLTTTGDLNDCTLAFHIKSFGATFTTILSTWNRVLGAALVAELWRSPASGVGFGFVPSKAVFWGNSVKRCLCRERALLAHWRPTLDSKVIKECGAWIPDSNVPKNIIEKDLMNWMAPGKNHVTAISTETFKYVRIHPNFASRPVWFEKMFLCCFFLKTGREDLTTRPEVLFQTPPPPPPNCSFPPEKCWIWIHREKHRATWHGGKREL